MLCSHAEERVNTMPKATKTLTIPNGGNMSLNKNQDQLEIHCTQECQWCYNDPSGVFPNFLPAGTVQPGTYGPYEAVNDGTVTYDDPTSGNCNASGGVTATPHSITVSG